MHRLLVSLSLAGVVAAGCGGSSGGDPDTDPASLAPARAPVYIEVEVGDDADFAAVAEKLTGQKAQVSDLIQKALEEERGGLDFKEDIQPWAGDRMALFLASFPAGGEDADGAFIAPADDADKAEESLARALKKVDADDKPPQISAKKHKDVEYQFDSANDNAYAIVGGAAVFGSEGGVKGAIDAEEGDSLADGDALKTARDQVDDDGTLFGYIGARELLSSIGGENAAAAQQVLSFSGDRIAFAADAEADSIDVEFVQLGVGEAAAETSPGSVLETLPGDAWLAGGVANAGQTIAKQLEQLGETPDGKELNEALAQLERGAGINIREDVLSWIGDVGFFVQGSSINDLGGALVIKATDPAKPKDLLSQLQGIAKAAGDVAQLRPLDQDGVEGVTIRDDELPMPVHVGVAGDRFIAAFGDAALKAAVSPSSKLTDSPAYKAAKENLGDDVEPVFFADLAPAKGLLQASGLLDQLGADAATAQRVIDHLTTVAAGSTREGDVQTAKFSVGVK